MKTATRLAEWNSDIRLNGFIAALELGCKRLMERKAEVCTLGLTVHEEDGSKDVKLYVVPAGSIVQQAIEDAVNRIMTDETFVRGMSFRSST